MNKYLEQNLVQEESSDEQCFPQHGGGACSREKWITEWLKVKYRNCGSLPGRYSDLNPTENLAMICINLMHFLIKTF